MKKNFLFNLIVTSLLFLAIPLAAVPATDQLSDLAQKTLKYANEKRTENKATPQLQWNQELADQANSHTKYMVDQKKLSHDGFADRYKAIQSKHRGSAMAENVAQTFDQEDVAKAVIKMWMESKHGHRENLLGNYKYVGISLIQKDRNWYATAIFANW